MEPNARPNAAGGHWRLSLSQLIPNPEWCASAPTATSTILRADADSYCGDKSNAIMNELQVPPDGP